ncbi:hypothetical protein GCM10011514_50880 [Emticicia aquatilis]|uniref:Uncharacterized protein n=1 Tax=Emticicia aquatilis TaxID=1537369 RepID=A0A917DXD8_9BACT|nr:hypothetical protein [Emticicia aquatilis]GGD80594.1 hypothetical protein GCM10011514_50880 [Emticicia aquatilis]
MSQQKPPIYDEPIDPELAKNYAENYLYNKHFKPEDFTAFYFHRDEIQIVLDKNPDKEYIKFTLGMKYLDHIGEKGRLYGCVMMSNATLVIDEENPQKIKLLGEGDEIYDYSHPVPPYPGE